MNEFEVLEIIGFRGDRMWALIQWWASVSFAVMTAAYFGSKKLNGVTASIILAMYTITTLSIFEALLNQIGFVESAYILLNEIGNSGVLSVIGTEAIERNGDSLSFMPAFWITGYLFTIVFVIYCYKKLGESQ